MALRRLRKFARQGADEELDMDKEYTEQFGEQSWLKVILDKIESDGFDVAAVLKNDPMTMDLPILILSIVQDKERGYRLGVDRYLTKPIEWQQLENTLAKYLNS